MDREVLGRVSVSERGPVVANERHGKIYKTIKLQDVRLDVDRLDQLR